MRPSVRPLSLVLLSVIALAAAEPRPLTVPEADAAQLREASQHGGAGIEEYLAVGLLPDGRIVAAGNCWGPDAAPGPAPLVLGSGRHRGLPVVEGGLQLWIDARMGGKRRRGLDLPPRAPAPQIPLSRINPDRSGFVAIWEADLSQVVGQWRFDWGLASIEAMRVAGNDLLIAGQATSAFVTQIAEQAPHYQQVDAPDHRDPAVTGKRFAHIKKSLPRRQREESWRAMVRANFGPSYYEGEEIAGHAYVARISPEGELRWVTILAEHRLVSDLAVVGDQVIVITACPRRLQLDDGSLIVAPEPLYLHRCDSIGQREGLLFRFGIGKDGSTTGPDPADRFARLAAHDPSSGRQLWAAYPWREALCQHPALDLPLMPWAGATLVEPDGRIVAAMNTTGIASPVQRNPFDLLRRPEQQVAWLPVGRSGGKKKRSKNPPRQVHLIRFDPRTTDCSHHLTWTTADPGDGTVTVDGICALSDGAVAIMGLTTDRLPGDSRQRPRRDANDHAWRYVAIFDGDLRRLRSVDVLPAVECTALQPTADGGVLVVGRARDANPGLKVLGQAPVTVGGQQHGGGIYDAWIARIGGAR